MAHSLTDCSAHGPFTYRLFSPWPSHLPTVQPMTHSLTDCSAMAHSLTDCSAHGPFTYRLFSPWPSHLPTELARLLTLTLCTQLQFSRPSSWLQNCAFDGALFHPQSIDYSFLVLNRHFPHFCGAILLLKHEALSRSVRISSLIDLSNSRRMNGVTGQFRSLALLNAVVSGGTVSVDELRPVTGPLSAVVIGTIGVLSQCHFVHYREGAWNQTRVLAVTSR